MGCFAGQACPDRLRLHQDEANCLDQGHFKVINKALMAVAAADMTLDILRGSVPGVSHSPEGLQISYRPKQVYKELVRAPEIVDTFNEQTIMNKKDITSNVFHREQKHILIFRSTNSLLDQWPA